MRRTAGRAPNDFCSVTARDLGAVKYEWRVAKSFWEPSGLGKVHREVLVEGAAPFKRRDQAELAAQALQQSNREPEVHFYSKRVETKTSAST